MFSLRMISSTSKRGTLGYASADMLARCDDRDSLRHANSIREQVQRRPPLFSLIPPASALRGTPGREVVLVQLSSRAELREIIRRRSPRRPHVCPTCVRASRMTRPCPPHVRSRRDHLKNKKEEEKNDEVRTRKTVESFQRERRRGWFVVVVVIDNNDTFLVNNENFYRLAGRTPALRRSSYNVSFFFFPSREC